jgi:hypothetical protein
MGRRNKKGSSSSSEFDKENKLREQIQTIRAILITSVDDTWKFWRPTEEEKNQIGLGDDDGDRPAASTETLDNLGEQLGQIFHILPKDICTAYSNTFTLSNAELAKEVRDVFDDRYETLRIQHGVAYRLLQLRYPTLYRVAECNGFLKSLEWNQMRQRLTQAAHTINRGQDLVGTNVRPSQQQDSEGT